MEGLLKIYAPEIPDFVASAAETGVLRRLRNVGMNCGCEYTSFTNFRHIGGYSRYEHSVGAALIVWHFTEDKQQTMAALLHDAASPCFAHVVDFLRGDRLAQEATEDGTEAIISAAADLRELLSANGLTPENVSDYHRFPVADNDPPRLSADRLEYSLGNAVNFGICRLADAEAFYNDLRVGKNEDGQPELCFRSPETARHFATAALECSKIYVCDEDRYAMEALSALLRRGLDRGVLSETDLYLTEPELIGKLCADPEMSRRWSEFRALSCLLRSDTPETGEGWYNIPAKKRCIDPLVEGRGRLSALDGEFSAALAAFRSRSQNYWLKGCIAPESRG